MSINRTLNYFVRKQGLSRMKNFIWFDIFIISFEKQKRTSLLYIDISYVNQWITIKYVKLVATSLLLDVSPYYLNKIRRLQQIEQ